MNGIRGAAAPIDPGVQGAAMSTEIDYRVGSLLAETRERRLATGTDHDTIRRRFGRAVIAVGRRLEGRTPVEPAIKRPGQPAAGARA
jgi:hypothetical protein